LFGTFECIVGGGDDSTADTRYYCCGVGHYSLSLMGMAWTLVSKGKAMITERDTPQLSDLLAVVFTTVKCVTDRLTDHQLAIFGACVVHNWECSQFVWYASVVSLFTQDGMMHELTKQALATVLVSRLPVL
jgi:hypothetical protein